MSASSNWIRSFFIHGTIGLLLTAFVVAQPATAAASDAILFPRTILALYDGKREAADTSRIFRNCQTVLNYLGMVVRYHDINQPLPTHAQMADCHGIVTWFASDSVYDPESYLRWLAGHLAQDKKLVTIGSIGFDVTRQPQKIRNQAQALYAHLGLKYMGNFTARRQQLRYAARDSAMVDFERRYPPLPWNYERFVPLDASLSVHLSLTRTDQSESQSAVVVTGAGGGMIWGDYALWQEAVPPYRRQWYVNPFAFFSKALGLGALPRPDVTTLNGRRIAFSHIDGDGFAGFTEVQPKAVCARVIQDRILTRYPFPVTVSVIVGEIDPSARGNAQREKLAREIMALPNVEPASHAYSHPFYWDPDYDNSHDRYASQYGISIPGYEFDAAMEIDYSVRYITEHLAPPGRPCRVFLWSGNCEPMASDIERCDNLGVFNMNGGDTVFDGINDSYTGVAPLYRLIDGRYQFYSCQANENILTNLWTGPYFGFREIITTMDRTERPRRIVPIDIYYHFYSGQYEASVSALETVYEWVLAQPIAPMFTSRYLRIAKSWLDCRILRDGSGRGFVIENYGDCLTMRFDDPSRVPDLVRCKHVIGYLQSEQGLYVHLAPGHQRARIVLREKADSSDGIGLLPHIRQASGWVRNYSLRADRLFFDYEGFGSGMVQLAGLAPGRTYELKGTAMDGQGDHLIANARGELTLQDVGRGTVEIGLR
ncbi:MAG: polysaccharide deacetylase [Deltaproteobacteria bacterium]|nr:MAG: polysaccharide deacetylase [Deltaproteobacteria bacterium]